MLAFHSSKELGCTCICCHTQWLLSINGCCPSMVCFGCRTRESFKGLGAYYKLAVPSTLMVCLEWWACECCLNNRFCSALL